MHNPPTIGLILKPGWDNIVVEIITSFLVLENRFRTYNKEDREMVYTALTGFSLLV
jgi:hypothetical protein